MAMASLLLLQVSFHFSPLFVFFPLYYDLFFDMGFVIYYLSSVVTLNSWWWNSAYSSKAWYLVVWVNFGCLVVVCWLTTWLLFVFDLMQILFDGLCGVRWMIGLLEEGIETLVKFGHLFALMGFDRRLL